MNLGKIFGSIMLCSCTSIGAGILALPTNTVSAGFFPTVFSFLISWFFLTISAFLLLEATLWHKKETNIISIANETLGNKGKIFAWIIYLLLLYALISAYLTASFDWLQTILKNQNIIISKNLGVPLLAFIFGTIVFSGTKIVDFTNRFLSIGLFAVYLILIFLIMPHVELNYLLYSNYSKTITPLPLIITTFGFAIVVPSLTIYLKQNISHLKIVISIGSIIPLIVYLCWEFVTLGTLSLEGSNGLAALAKQQASGAQVALALENVIDNHVISIAAKFFSIFAIITSLIGVSLSLFHFLADGFQISKKGFSGIKLFGLTFIPPVFLVLFFPAGFDQILSLGGIFVASLLGLLPIAMTWNGRYKNNLRNNFIVPGGKPLLIISSLFFFYIICQEIINLL